VGKVVNMHTIQRPPFVMTDEQFEAWEKFLPGQREDWLQYGHQHTPRSAIFLYEADDHEMVLWRFDRYGRVLSERCGLSSEGWRELNEGYAE
jgi:hypothetical protein